MTQGLNLLTPEEAAKRLGLDRRAKNPKRTILDMCRRGDLTGVRVSRWIMVDPRSVDRYIDGAV